VCVLSSVAHSSFEYRSVQVCLQFYKNTLCAWPSWDSLPEHSSFAEEPRFQLMGNLAFQACWPPSSLSSNFISLLLTRCCCCCCCCDGQEHLFIIIIMITDISFIVILQFILVCCCLHRIFGEGAYSKNSILPSFSHFHTEHAFFQYTLSTRHDHHLWTTIVVCVVALFFVYTDADSSAIFFFNFNIISASEILTVSIPCLSCVLQHWWWLLTCFTYCLTKSGHFSTTTSSSPSSFSSSISTHTNVIVFITLCVALMDFLKTCFFAPLFRFFTVAFLTVVCVSFLSVWICLCSFLCF